MKTLELKSLDYVKIKNLRCMCGVTSRRRGVIERTSNGVDRKILKWIAQMEDTYSQYFQTSVSSIDKQIALGNFMWRD